MREIEFTNRFIMLVGIAGSGKSTFARRIMKIHDFFTEDVVLLSSDDIREELYGDASNQSSPSKVFTLMNERTSKALTEGKSVIYDATNLVAERRKLLVQAIHNKFPNCRCDCVQMVISTEECIARQAYRARKVPAAVITRQARQLETPTYSEGWDCIGSYVKNDEGYFDFYFDDDVIEG